MTFGRRVSKKKTEKKKKGYDQTITKIRHINYYCVGMMTVFCVALDSLFWYRSIHRFRDQLLRNATYGIV
jgi:hypothetical protein